MHVKSPHTSNIMWQYISLKKKALMAEWLEQASQGHKMYYYDLEFMGLNPSRVELEVRSDQIYQFIPVCRSI